VLPRSELPPLLRAIHDPPRRLYLRGNGERELMTRPTVAVVGARACSPYGAQIARLLGRELAAAGVVVVSGLARGVDGEAHRGALQTDGHTVAVLGCGIDRNYPAAHARLAGEIAERSLIVSEYEPGVEPAPWRIAAWRRRRSGSRKPARRSRVRRWTGQTSRSSARGSRVAPVRGRSHARACASSSTTLAEWGQGRAGATVVSRSAEPRRATTSRA